MRAAMIRDHKKKIANDLSSAGARRNLFDHAMFRLARHAGACQKIAQLARLTKSRREIVQLLERRISRALSERDIRERIRILQTCRLQFGLPSRLFTKLSISDSCAAGVNCFASSDSAPSTASDAASAFNSMRAARSAASTSA